MTITMWAVTGGHPARPISLHSEREDAGADVSSRPPCSLHRWIWQPKHDNPEQCRAIREAKGPDCGYRLVREVRLIDRATWTWEVIRHPVDCSFEKVVRFRMQP